MGQDRHNTGSQIALTLARQGAGAVLRLAFVVLVARALGPAGNGQYALAILVPTLLAATLNLGIPTANGYFVASGALSLARALQLSVRIWLVLVIVGGASLGLVTLLSARLLPGLAAQTVALAGLLFPLNLATSFMAGLLQARKDFGAFNRVLLVAPVLSLVLLTLVWFAGEPITVEISLSVQLAAECVATAYCVAAVRRHARDQAVAASSETVSALALIRFGGVLQVGSLLMHLSYRLDLYLVNLYLGPTAAGVYYIGVRIAEQVWLASQAAGSVLLPELASRGTTPDAGPALATRAVRLALYPGLALGAALAAVAPWLVPLLFGDAYGQATKLVVVLLPGTLLLNAARIACIAMSARGRPELTVAVNATILVVSLGLNLWWIPSHALIGAACATSVAYAVGTGVALILLARLYQQPLHHLLTPTRQDVDALRRTLQPSSTHHA